MTEIPDTPSDELALVMAKVSGHFSKPSARRAYEAVVMMTRGYHREWVDGDDYYWIKGDDRVKCTSGHNVAR